MNVVSGEVRVEGRDAATEYAMAWLRAFPDARLKINNELADDDWVVQEFTFEGTHGDVAVSPDVLLPAPGIYAGWYDGVYAAAISVGRRPTFHDGSSPVVVEAYLLDFKGDLYGAAARVSFVSRLRDEERG